MRKFIYIAILFFGASAFAQNVECVNTAGTKLVLYKAVAMVMQEMTLNGNQATNPIARPIGQIDDKPGLTDDYSVFSYPIGGGASYEITWVSGNSEIMRHLRGEPVSAVKKQGNRVVEVFPSCKYSTRE